MNRVQERGVTPLFAAGARAIHAPGLLTRNTVALILAGGRGTRLAGLTNWRAKPSVPFGGKFRIIDFALSNCVNSGIRRIGICTQYKAQSLIRHVQRGWSFLDGRFDEFVELLPAQQRVQSDWYRGTADAVYQNLDILRRHAPDHVLILAGDHVYKMHYGRMLEEHAASGASLTIACIDVPIAEAKGLGVIAVDADGGILDFEEKPAHPVAIPGRPDRILANMGVYMFDADFLYDVLVRDADDATSSHDFGRDVIPRLLAERASLRVHDFAQSCVNIGSGGPYWKDVGTVDAFWEANLALVGESPELDLYDEAWPIWTYQEQLPPAKFESDGDGRRGVAIDSIVGSGCVVRGSTVRRSLLFSNVRLQPGCTIEDSVVLPNVELACDVVLKRTVIDKHCRLPPGLRAGADRAEDRRRFHVTESGVTLIIPEMLGQRIHQPR